MLLSNLFIHFVLLIKQITVGREMLNRLKDEGNEEDKES